MKLLNKNISSKDGSGTIKLCPDTPDDLWHAYNLLQPPNDLFSCTTLRKVVQTSSTGSTTSQKVHIHLTLRVTKVDFDPDSLQVRISGPNVKESKHVKMGAHHTITLELGRNFTIEKECWDQIFLDRIEEACHPELAAEVAAIVMQPGLAHLCLVTGSITVTKARIDVSIPKKRTGSNNHVKAMERFYEGIYQAVLNHVDFDHVKCVLCGSSGYVKDDFYKYLCEQSVRRGDRKLIENKQKFVLCKASSGHKHALEEVFSDESIMARMTETKIAKEMGALTRFMRMIDTDPDKAYYGYNHVQKANEELAIDTLLVTDELFRSSDIVTRKKYVQLVESVREHGGTVYVFSALHVTGVQLGQLSGVAAILRYPLPDLDQLELDAAEAAMHEEDEDHNHDDDDEIGGSGEDGEKDLEQEMYERVMEDVADMGL